ncbi:hypothetical protein LTS10_012002 [Elasticomyces elasticus]|nr:hypothetical protein LTS10_012002 [Elasticomyces elasticus]
MVILNAQRFPQFLLAPGVIGRSREGLMLVASIDLVILAHHTEALITPGRIKIDRAAVSECIMGIAEAVRLAYAVQLLEDGDLAASAFVVFVVLPTWFVLEGEDGIGGAILAGFVSETGEDEVHVPKDRGYGGGGAEEDGELGDDDHAGET